MAFGPYLSVMGTGNYVFSTELGNITQIVISFSESGDWSGANAGWPSELYTYEAGTFTWSGTPASSVTRSSDGGSNINGITSIVFTIEPATVAAGTALTPDATRKVWTLDKMPAGNVTVSVEYFPQAEFAMSTDATPVALAPKASTSARANTDDPLVEGGTVAGIVDDEAMLEEGQGTLLYHFSATQLDADALEALTATDWTDKVPTADGLAEGTVYVYYYIKGADELPGITPGAKFTFSDSDIQELAVNVHQQRAGFVNVLCHTGEG